MKKKLLTTFADWYLQNREGKTSNYVSKLFMDDRDVFVDNLSEIASEYAINFGYNPFVFEASELGNHVEKIKEDLKSKTSESFEKYNKDRWSGVPKALLGKSNYIEFLQQLDGVSKKQSVELHKKDKKQIVFTSEELYDNFKFRIFTQDRLYDELYFPISVLKKIFYQKDRDFIDNWVKVQLDNIKLFTQDSELKLAEIKSLSFENNQVYINTKSEEKQLLYTPVAGKQDMEAFSVDKLRQIVIDHIEPFEKVYLSQKNELTELQRIHIGLLIMNDGDDISDRNELKRVGNLFLNSRFFDDVDIELLKKQMTSVLEKISLQLMDSKQNLYKKKYDNE